MTRAAVQTLAKADAAAHLAESWTVQDPAFEADAICPLMPVWPWGGHRGFAYDLVRFLRPRLVCELGVHWGTSLFAFAQAVKDSGLKTAIMGVDTWAGDGHTGPYGPEVLATVERTIAAHYRGITFRLHRKTFDEALAEAPDGAVDLLHIDGFHEYDAVKHDFETWLPKLSENGVVLLHDTAESTGYGSAAYWKELCARHPGFGFEHSWGLGVVFPKGDRVLRAMQANGIDDKRMIYTHRAEARLLAIRLADTERLALDRMAAIERQSGIIEERTRYIAELEKRIESDGALLRERMAAIDAQSRLIEERDAHLRELERVRGADGTLLRERYDAIERQSEMIRQRDAHIAMLGAEMTAAAKLLEERLGAIREQGRLIDERTAWAKDLEGRVAALEEGARARALEFAAERERAESLRLEASIAASRVDGLRRRLESAVADAEAARAEATIAQRRVQSARAEAWVREEANQELRAELKEAYAVIEELRGAIDRLATDVKLLNMRTDRLEEEVIRTRGQRHSKDGGGLLGIFRRSRGGSPGRTGTNGKNTSGGGERGGGRR